MRQAQRPSAAIVTPNRLGRSSRSCAPLLLVAAMISGEVAAEPTKGWQAATAPPGARLDLSDPNLLSELEPGLGLARSGVPLNLSHWRARARKRSWEQRERAMRSARIPLVEARPMASSPAGRVEQAHGIRPPAQTTTARRLSPLVTLVPTAAPTRPSETHPSRSGGDRPRPLPETWALERGWDIPDWAKGGQHAPPRITPTHATLPRRAARSVAPTSSMTRSNPVGSSS